MPTKSLIAGCCGLACQLPDQIHFRLAIRRSVGTQHLVKPHRRLVENIRMLPRFPRKIRLRFARNKSPVDRSHALLLRNRQHCVKGAPHRTRHVFCADYRPVILFQPRHLTFKVFRPTVIVKSDNVRLPQLNRLQFTRSPASVEVSTDQTPLVSGCIGLAARAH